MRGVWHPGHREVPHARTPLLGSSNSRDLARSHEVWLSGESGPQRLRPGSISPRAFPVGRRVAAHPLLPLRRTPTCSLHTRPKPRSEPPLWRPVCFPEKLHAPPVRPGSWPWPWASLALLGRMWPSEHGCRDKTGPWSQWTLLRSWGAGGQAETAGQRWPLVLVERQGRQIPAV